METLAGICSFLVIGNQIAACVASVGLLICAFLGIFLFKSYAGKLAVFCIIQIFVSTGVIIACLYVIGQA